MDDKPLPKEVFEDIFTRDTDEEFNEIYLAVFTEMYKLPPKDESAKNWNRLPAVIYMITGIHLSQMDYLTTLYR